METIVTQIKQNVDIVVCDVTHSLSIPRDRGTFTNTTARASSVKKCLKEILEEKILKKNCEKIDDEEEERETEKISFKRRHKEEL